MFKAVSVKYIFLNSVSYFALLNSFVFIFISMLLTYLLYTYIQHYKILIAKQILNTNHAIMLNEVTGSCNIVSNEQQDNNMLDIEA